MLNFDKLELVMLPIQPYLQEKYFKHCLRKTILNFNIQEMFNPKSGVNGLRKEMIKT